MIETLFSLENLKNTFDEISTYKGIDEVSYTEFRQNLESNLSLLQKEIFSNKFIVEPVAKIELKKGDKTRPITLSSIRDRIVQKILAKYLNKIYNNKFSNKSYAYRPNKSTLKAVNRVEDFIKRKNFWILKSDIKDFFETINHDILLKLLKQDIKDEIILNLLIQYMKMGAFDYRKNYIEHKVGVYQGNIISPILSNLYLDMMDKFLERHNINFVRFADDFVILANKRYKIEWAFRNLKRFLNLIKLQLNDNKTYIIHANDGFVFLGVFFKGSYKTIENSRLEKINNKLFDYAKQKMSFDEFIEKFNTYYWTLKNYYLKIINKDSTQFQSLKHSITNSISHKVFYLKKEKIINKKHEFFEKLKNILFLDFFEDKDSIIEFIISKAYNKYHNQKIEKKIDKKKNIYAKKFSNESTLHISKFGTTLGISKNRFVLKKYGKTIKEFPISKIKRIILEGKGFLVSSDVFFRASKYNIHIDFIDYKANPFSSVIHYNSATTHLIHKQALILKTPKQIKIAIQFLKGKLKNQLNYLKYLNKYHHNLDENIITIQKIIDKLKSSKTIEELMGYEGSCSAVYWDGIKKILDIEFIGRVTYHAKDIVNSSLNYAYAILYGKVQFALVNAGVSLHISFLHSLQKQKPTLVYDMIEEFRVFIVDRVIISMINKNEPIKLNKEGFLTDDTKKLIAKNIYEKLGSYTTWRKQSIKIENIIQRQAYALRDFILEDKTYKPFIGKF